MTRVPFAPWRNPPLDPAEQVRAAPYRPTLLNMMCPERLFCAPVRLGFEVFRSAEQRSIDQLETMC